MRKDKHVVSITRPFTIVVYPDHDEPTQWIAHVIGPELDNMTFADSPEGAAYMAYDLISALTGFCSMEHREHDYSIDAAMEDGTPAWECTRCDVKTVKSAFDDYVAPSSDN